MMGVLLTVASAQKIVVALCWMLIHSIWQGLALSMICTTMLLLNKKSSSVFRYNLALAIFAVFIVGCASTFLWEWRNALRTAGAPLGALPTMTSFFIKTITLRDFISTLNNYIAAHTALVALCWLAVFTLKSAGVVSALVYNQRLKNRYIHQPPQRYVKLVDQLCQKLQVKKEVVLLGTGYLNMPSVIGHLKPVLLMPIKLLTGMSSVQVEIILLHELAHIRRNDYLVNFLQLIVEAIFFFNPGLLWLSNVMREERENCCDDMALEQTRDKCGFVQALISFKEYELLGSTYVTAFAGKKNYFFRRVSRILDNQNYTLGAGGKMLFMAGVVILTSLVAITAIARVYPPKKTAHSARKNIEQTTSNNVKTVKEQAEARDPIKTDKRNISQRRNDTGIILKELVKRQYESEVKQAKTVKHQVEDTLRQEEGSEHQIEDSKRQAEGVLRQKEEIKRENEAVLRQTEAIKRQAEVILRQQEMIRRQAHTGLSQQKFEKTKPKS